MQFGRVRRALTSVLLPALLGGCAGERVVVMEPRAAAVPASAKLRAAAREVDITPPVGAPLFGYSWGAASASKGYWTRLKARVIALEDGRGERFVLVQADLGAISGLLQRSVAARTAEIGISADRLLIAATHTHAGPGGYFGQRFFNFFGAGKPGYDPRVLEHLVSKLSQGIRDAFAELAPAALAATSIDVLGVSRNRSKEARWNDFACPCLADAEADVDTKLRLLRIDRVDATDSTDSTPLAALFVFGVHGTSIAETNDLYHGDLHAVASRVLAWKVHASHPQAPPLVAAFMNGTEGDVSPAYSQQGPDEAIRLGSTIGEGAYRAFRSLDGQLERNVDISHAYREIVMPGTQTSSGAVCGSAEIGIPTIAGAEDGRSFLYGGLNIFEGSRRSEPLGCQGYKLGAFGVLQGYVVPQAHAPGQSLFHFFEGNSDPGSFPRIAPFSVVRFGRALVLATIPGEPTTEIGRRVRTRLERALQPAGRTAPTPLIGVVGLANEYLYYFTTPGEFRAQHYEGGSTLYGPLQGLASEEQLEAAALALDTPSAQRYYGQRTFTPGDSKHFWAAPGACRSNDWRALGTHVQRAADGRIQRVRFEFVGLANGEDCGGYPAVRVACGGAPLIGPEGAVEDDEGYRFELRRESHWSASWRPPAGLPKISRCRIEVSRHSAPALQSEEFEL
ncbi:MAG: neutral/alkaline non-lysosomal ceramidase N-terminal domain-containing protein [Myxococcota bacterium]